MIKTYQVINGGRGTGAHTVYKSFRKKQTKAVYIFLKSGFRPGLRFYSLEINQLVKWHFKDNPLVLHDSLVLSELVKKCPIIT